MRETAHSRQREYRWNILIISCAATFGAYYSSDTSSALHGQLSRHFDNSTIERTMEFETFFNLLYVLYSLPNIILPLLSGLLVARFGMRKLIVSLSMLVFFGQFLIATGVGLRHMPIALFGRFLFGMGAESLSVIVVTLLSLWFEGQEVGFALAVNLSVARLATTVNDWLSPIMAEQALPKAYWFGCLLCVVSVVAAVVLVMLDYYMTIVTPANTNTNAAAAASVSPIIKRQSSELDIYHAPAATASHYLLLLLLLLSYCCYGAIVSFTTISGAVVGQLLPQHLVRKDVIAARYTSIPFFLSAVLSPPFGFLADHGHKPLLLLFSPLLLLPAYVMLYMRIAYALPICMIGVAYALFGAVVWPTLPLVVEDNATGLGFGLVAVAQNAATAITPLLAAFIYTSTRSYDNVLVVFGLMAIIGMVAGVGIMIVDELYFNAKLRLKTLQDTVEMPVLLLDESTTTNRPPRYRATPLATTRLGIAYPKAKSATLTALIQMESVPLLPITQRPRSYSSITGNHHSQEFDKQQLQKTKSIRRSFKF